MKANTIIITGAGQRIGLALAEYFAQQSYQVIISYRTERNSIQYLRDLGVTCIQADFTTHEGILFFTQSVLEKQPMIRCIIHNASDWNAEKNTDDYADLLDQMIQIHVKAPYLLNLAFEPLLKQSAVADSDIIHLTDYVVSKGSAKHLAYAASKAALHNLTQSFAQKLAPYTKVNSIAPALIMFNENDDDEYKQKAQQKSLLQIPPGAEEVINAVNFILQSRYMTGQSINIDGGRAFK